MASASSLAFDFAVVTRTDEGKSLEILCGDTSLDRQFVSYFSHDDYLNGMSPPDFMSFSDVIKFLEKETFLSCSQKNKTTETSEGTIILEIFPTNEDNKSISFEFISAVSSDFD